MKYLLLLITILFLSSGAVICTFRDEQLNHTRVKMAYTSKEKNVAKTLADNLISRDSLRIYMRAFKTEKKIELWAKNVSDSAYILLKEFPICEISGEIGPKRCYKDYQVPEGFYRISELNPYSKYFLSMKINYPNASDSIRGKKGRLGSLIFIHGGCESSGCIAVNDEKIKELFVYCIEAYNSGQKDIEMTIFPAQLTDATYTRLTKGYGKNKDFVTLWGDLKKSYDLFNQTHNPPSITFLADGTHEVK